MQFEAKGALRKILYLQQRVALSRRNNKYQARESSRSCLRFKSCVVEEVLNLDRQDLTNGFGSAETPKRLRLMALEIFGSVRSWQRLTWKTTG
jgi:hypothetical protein